MNYFFLSGLCVNTEPEIFLISGLVREPGLRNPFDAIDPISFDVFSFFGIDDSPPFLANASASAGECKRSEHALRCMPMLGGIS